MSTNIYNVGDVLQDTTSIYKLKERRQYGWDCIEIIPCIDPEGLSWIESDSVITKTISDLNRCELIQKGSE